MYLFQRFRTGQIISLVLPFLKCAKTKKKCQSDPPPGNLWHISFRGKTPNTFRRKQKGKKYLWKKKVRVSENKAGAQRRPQQERKRGGRREGSTGGIEWTNGGVKRRNHSHVVWDPEKAHCDRGVWPPLAADPRWPAPVGRAPDHAFVAAWRGLGEGGSVALSRRRVR